MKDKEFIKKICNLVHLYETEKVLEKGKKHKTPSKADMKEFIPKGKKFGKMPKIKHVKGPPRFLNKSEIPEEFIVDYDTKPKKCKCPKYKDFNCKYHNPITSYCEYDE